MSLACESLDLQVDVAASVEDALAAYDGKRHSLVLTDYQMEPANGIDLVLRLQELDPAAKIIFMTGYGCRTGGVHCCVLRTIC